MRSRFRAETGSPYDIPRPAHRRLKIFSIDPSLAQSLETKSIRSAIVEIPWEVHPEYIDQDGPALGPRGEYVEVIDFDPSSGAYYKPVDLNDPYLLAQDGLDPSDGNPQFHQQMVYAVAMRTIRNFEIALGRRALWAPFRSHDKGKYKEEYVQRLRIYPHALREANAYYSPEKKSLLMGYFQASPDSSMHMPGGTVFTCLSHDIIAHEISHALLDGMHRRFIEPTNPDVLAFHEAFADIVAIFQHFTFTEILKHEIAKTKGRLETDNLLGGLAREFGQALGRTGALRSAIGSTPEPTELSRVTEPHLRGALLVAAVFDAFLAIYRIRTADLFRLSTQGTGILPDGAIHPDLVSRLAAEAAKASQHVLTICIRALDYLPPVDVTFGDYLRALITADFDLVPNDSLGYRVAFIEAFRRRGIFPDDVRSMSEESLRWEGPALAVGIEDAQVYLGRNLRSLTQSWNLSGDRREIYEKCRDAQAAAHEIIRNTINYKQTILRGLDLRKYEFEVHSLRPVRRSGPDGQLLMDIVVEVTQRLPGYLSKSLNQSSSDAVKRKGKKYEKTPDFWFRGGCTIIFDLETGRLRYCIYKDINSEYRYDRQRAYVAGDGSGQSLNATYFETLGSSDGGEIFAFMHRNY